MIFSHLHPSPVGELLVAVDDSGVLLRLAFLTERVSLQAEKQRGAPAGRDRCTEVCQQLDQYFAGARRRFELDLRPAGTEFQRRVWGAVQQIPYGTTASYGEIAVAVGSSGASRAVGAANGRNPIAIVIPCHRVIGGDRSLTGYGGGLEIKRTLLQLEGALPPGAAQTMLPF